MSGADRPGGVPLRQGLGPRAEDAACAFLESQGYSVLARNFRCARGELDVVAREGAALVFVEVKARTGGGWGAPEEAVDARKRLRLLRAAQAYLGRFGWSAAGGAADCRFDIVALRTSPGSWCRITLLKGAF